MTSSCRRPQFRRTRRGFSLVEVVLALGIFAFVLLTCMALVSMSSDGVHDVVKRDEAIRLTRAVEVKFEEMGFDGVFEILQSGQPVFAFFYRGHPTETLSDGRPRPHQVEGVVGEDYNLIPVVLQEADPEFDDLVAAADHGIYQLQLEVSAANPVETLPDSAADYPEALLALKAVFLPAPEAIARSNPERDIAAYATTLTIMR